MDWTQYAVSSHDQTISGRPRNFVLVVITISVVAIAPAAGVNVQVINDIGIVVVVVVVVVVRNGLDLFQVGPWQG